MIQAVVRSIGGLWVALLCLAAVAAAEEGRVSIVIGEPIAAGEQARPGALNNPFGVDFDAAGNIYVVELEGGRVHRRDPAGKLTTIAGDGTKGHAGDGGPTREATFNGMHNLAVTAAGDIYVSDSWNHCVRKIDAKTGIITTIAGTGEPGFGGDGGPAREATFDYLMCVSLDRSESALYVADMKNLRVRKIDLASGIVTTVAGNGEKGVPADGARAVESPLVDPRAAAVDSRGNVYIVERGGHALRVVTPDGRIRTVAGTGKAGLADGPALEAQMRGPKHLAIDAQDNVLIADDQNGRIRKFDPRAGTLTSVMGKGVEGADVELNRPHGVYSHADGSIYVTDSWNHRIVRLAPE